MGSTVGCDSRIYTNCFTGTKRQAEAIRTSPAHNKTTHESDGFLCLDWFSRSFGISALCFVQRRAVPSFVRNAFALSVLPSGPPIWYSRLVWPSRLVFLPGPAPVLSLAASPLRFVPEFRTPLSRASSPLRFVPEFRTPSLSWASSPLRFVSEFRTLPPHMGPLPHYDLCRSSGHPL